VSFGAMSMFLTGAPGILAHATNPCAASKTTAAHWATARTTTATGRSGARSGTHARHVSHLPVLLDATARAISAAPAGQHAGAAVSAGLAGQHAGAASTASGSPSSSPSPSPSPHPSLGPPPTPDPSPGGGMVTPSASSTPRPGSSANTTPRHTTPTISPGGTNSTPTASPTPTATPTPTPTSTAPTATLCLSVQTVGGSTVEPSSTVQFDIVLWLTSGTGGTAKVSVDASPSSVNPTFSVCQTPGQSTCTVTGLKAGQHIETQAELTASKTFGTAMTLTVSATSTQAAKSASTTANFQVEASPSPSPTPTPTPTSGNAGNAANLSTVGLPGSNPSFPGVTNPAGNVGSVLPQVSPSPNTAPKAPGRHQHQIKTADLSAGLPLTVRLIGGQVIGLAVLAAAVTIAVARLSLRRQPARHNDDSTGSKSASS
jgi:hypothetical protein